MDGLGLLDLEIAFAPDKVLAQVQGDADGIPLRGYEIHHGRVRRNGDAPLLSYADGGKEGSVRGSVRGTHWHGILENDEYRRRLLTEVAETAGRAGFAVAPDTDVAQVREAQLDLLADLVEQHLDVDAVLATVDGGAAMRLPTIVSRVT